MKIIKQIGIIFFCLLTVSLLPKSVTTPIAVSIAQPHGGIVPVTVIAVIFTGILGSVLAPVFMRVFKVSDPVAAGVAIGTSSHAIGTAKAIELGEVEGAMSGLVIGICGIITVLFSIWIL
ncbi:LrgB family protein [Mediterraneibacter sp. ICN-202921]|uniref:LrgB family protein n=1 Tax=Mediterraneibacter sp. ICN-202921 TaxID=3134657 RepID=UPI0030BF15B8